jgi:hypothetical protein
MLLRLWEPEYLPKIYRLGPLRISTHIVRGGPSYDWRWRTACTPPSLARTYWGLDEHQLPARRKISLTAIGDMESADLPVEQDTGATIRPAAKLLSQSARVTRNEYVGHPFQNWICEGRLSRLSSKPRGLIGSA